jgi:hypothetical protein
LHVSGDYGPLVLFCELGVQSFPELVLVSLSHFYLHFPTVQSWAMRPFAWPAFFDEGM